MENFKESVSIFRRASSKIGAFLCLLAVVTFTLPVGAQRGANLDRRGAKGSSAFTDSVQNAPQAPLANPVMYAYSTEPGSILTFNANSPDTIISEKFLVGLDDENTETLGFIDFRPVNGVLYAVANKDQPQVTSRLVTIDLSGADAVVTSVGGTIPQLGGLFYGGDFNPVVDRLREVSRTGKNRRLNPNDGTVTAVDTDLKNSDGSTPEVNHIAYTNNFAGATSTTLYGIDVATDSLVIIGSPGGSPNSPNAGQVTPVGPLAARDIDGNLRNVVNFGGFDIQPGTGLAYAALRLASVTGGDVPIPSISNLYSINLSTGAATLIGEIGTDFIHTIDGLSIGTATASASADLSITKTDGFTTYVPGSTRPYTIVASNAGPDPVTGAVVSDAMSAQFSSFTWTCTGTGGGTCPASGSGSINAFVNLPVGATVTFQLQATVSQSATGVLVNTATITPPADVTDPNTNNSSSSTDTNTILTTAGDALVSGRVMSPDGRGLRGARVTIVDSNGVAVSVLTSSLGYYTFDDLESGETFIIGVASKQYRFDSRVIQVSDSLTDVNFIGIE